METKNKNKILKISGLILVAVVVLISFSNLPTQLFTGQLKIDPAASIPTEPDFTARIWKLTNLPTSAPLGTVVSEEKIIDSNDPKSNNIDLLDIAVEAESKPIVVKSLTFEIDLDDNDRLLSAAEKQSYAAIDSFTLLNAQGAEISTAKPKIATNQILFTFDKLQLQILKTQTSVFSVSIIPNSTPHDPANLRIQFAPEFSNITQTTGNSAKISADLGQNNNSKTADDFLASETFIIR